MSRPVRPNPAMLVVGILTARRDRFPAVAARLAERFGPVDLVGPWWPFDFTDYYEAEMGAPLHRRMMAFRRLTAQSRLAEIKLATNAIEADFLDGAGGRSVNIDPGHLLAERFVLASGKNFTHRIYVGRGIYADLTLVYRKGAFHSLPWTYPDYAGDRIQSFLQRARDRYREAIRRREGAPRSTGRPG